MATPVPELLSSGATRYLLGAETLGQWDGTAWAYVLPDALGSVRQTVDRAGAVTADREWSPYGAEVGGAQAGLGYTGEWQAADVGLVYLRARWYQAETGMLTQRDPVAGLAILPATQQPYRYGLNNPLLFTDASGRFACGPGNWEDCLQQISDEAVQGLQDTNAALLQQISDEAVQGLQDTNAALLQMLNASYLPAGLVVEEARGLYDKGGGLAAACLTRPDDGQWPTDTVNDLFIDFVCEYGPQHRYFNGEAHLTRQLANTATIQRLRQEFYFSGYNQRGTYEFNFGAVLWATLDTLYEGDRTRYGWELPQLNITHFLGSFTYRVERHWSQGAEQVRFQVDNQTDLVSGTRLPPPFGVPVSRAEETDVTSVEQLILDNPQLANQSLLQIILEHKVISILRPKKSRDSTTLTGLGGGTMFQTFIWQEPVSGCGYVPLPLQIENSAETYRR